MRILDFTNNRRSFLISQCKNDETDYSFHYISGRKTYLTENKGDLGDIERFCPEILCNKIDINKLEEMHDRDVVITTSMSMLFKEYEKRVFRFLNSFKGKLVSVDYAWDAMRKARKKGKNGFNRGIDAVAVIGDTCAYNIPSFYYSQPEIDIFAHVNDFLDRQYVIDRYNLPQAEKYVLVTSKNRYETVPNLIKFIKRQHGDIHVIWKLKEKQEEFFPTVRKLLKRCNFSNYTLMSSPPDRLDSNPNRSQKDFFSPVAEFARIIDCHISLPPMSFANMEMMRAGIPTYIFDGNNFKKPKLMGDVLNKIFDIVWTEESLQNCYSGDVCLDRSKCEVKIDKYFFTNNFLNNLEKFIS